MGDLFLHLPFARRLRYADGLHPLACEALVRRSPLVTLGASLPDLPVASTKSGGLFSRLFKRGRSEALRWEEILHVGNPPNPDLVLRLLAPSGGAAPGAMARLALGLGLLSHELLAEELHPIYAGLDAATRAAVERGQARLWLQFAIPSKRDLDHEWAPALAFHELESHRAVLDHVEAAIRAAFGKSPGRDMVSKWARSLFTEVTPLLEKGGMPDPGSVPDHTVKAKYYDGEARFLDRAQSATSRFVYLAGRIAEQFLGKEPGVDDLREALCDESGALRAAPSSSELGSEGERWRRSIGEARQETLTRGRNPRAAFHQAADLFASLPDLPPLPADDDEDSGASPTVTQEVSLAQIEAEMAGEGFSRAPAMTQEVSLAQIEEDTAGASPPSAPATTQQISAADIEAEIEGAGGPPPPPPSEASEPGAPVPRPPVAPTSTQQISAADIEAEMESRAAQPPPPPPELSDPTVTPPFGVPAKTQQISAADIEAEIEESHASPPPPPESTESMPVAAGPRPLPPSPEDARPPPAPAATQQISAADIEAEMESRAPPAPAATQQISAADIEAELEAAPPPRPLPGNVPAPVSGPMMAAPAPAPEPRPAADGHAKNGVPNGEDGHGEEHAAPPDKASESGEHPVSEG